MRIARGKRIPRDDGKLIEELVGVANTRTRSVSVARMLAPPGWSEPPQRPEFDEVVVVLEGELTLVFGRKVERIATGEAGWVSRGQRVVYRNDRQGACEYLSVCVPAFRPELAHIEAPAVPPRGHNVVEVIGRHRKAGALRRPLEASAQRFLQALELEHVELAVSLVGDSVVRDLNRVWRGKDQATDVLSFPADPPPRGAPGARPLGDVIISLDTAARQARTYGQPLLAEVELYLAHGLLHLLGYDHRRPAQARRMAREERRLLGRAGMVSGPSP